MIRTGSAEWNGGIIDGKGTVSTETGTLSNAPYSFTSRFEEGKGTNPEELLGAAHAGCFSMALSAVLGGAQLTADSIKTSAAVSVVKIGDGFVIDKVHLTVEASIPEATAEQFAECAANAKANCPVSKLFSSAEITMDAKLV